MARVFVGIGSNADRLRNIRLGLARLRERFGRLLQSPVYESRAVGFAGEDFYNLVVAFDTTLEPPELVEVLHGIEDECDRDRNEPRFSSRTLDLDLLLYDDRIAEDPDIELPRSEITRFAFVLKPLADIAGDLKHPQSGQRFADLWDLRHDSLQPCWPVQVEL